MTSQQDHPPSPSPSHVDLPSDGVDRLALLPAIVTPPHRIRRAHVPPPLADRAGSVSTRGQLSPVDEYLLKRGIISNAPSAPDNVAVSSDDGGSDGRLFVKPGRLFVESGSPKPGSPEAQPGSLDGEPASFDGEPASQDGGAVRSRQGGHDREPERQDSGSDPFNTPSPVPLGRLAPIQIDEEVYDLLARPLRTFKCPDEDQIHNLLDALWVEFPAVPGLYNVSALKSTRKPTTFDIKMASQERLEKIVWLDESALAEIRLEVATLLHRIPVDMSNDTHKTFVHRIHPWYNALDCPKMIHSEVDTEDWTNQVIFRPALAIVHALIHGSIIEDEALEPRFPFLSSAHNGRNNKPDVTLTLKGKHPDDEVGLCVEDKTEAVFSKRKNPLAEVQTYAHGQIAGSAHKFNWPKTDSHVAHLNKNSGDSILVQIWSQLIEWEACWGILTSMDATVFYSRDEDHENTLFMTGALQRDEPVLFMAVCWILLACDVQFLSSNTPEADTTWWTDEMHACDEPGVCLCAH